MSEQADFILKLNDQVSGPAKAAADSLRKVDAAAQAAQQRGLDRFASAWDKIGRAADYAAIKQQRALGASFSKIGLAASRDQEKAVSAQAKAASKAAAEIRKMNLAHLAGNKMNADFDKKKADAAKGNTFFGGFGAKLGFRSVADYAKGAFIGDLAAKGVETIIGGFVTGAKMAVDLVASGVKMAFSEGGKAENLRLSYKLLLGDKGGKDALADISGFAGKTKYDDDDIATMMRPLFNAGLRGTGARSAFAASGDLEAAGLGPAQEFIEQFSRIQLKGGVTEKILVGMGVNIRDFKTALAAETGETNKEIAFKKATEGKADPQAIMNAIFRGIENRQGGELGTGTEAASKTMSARLDKLSNLPSQYLKKMSESPDWQKLSDKFGDVLLSLDPDSERGQKIVGSLFKTFNEIADSINEALSPENLDGFVNAIQGVVKDVGGLFADLRDLIHYAAHPKDFLFSAVGSHVGDSARANSVDILRKAGTLSDDKIKSEIANMSPEDREALLKKGKESDFDYSKLVPDMAPGVRPANDNSKRPINLTWNGDTHIVTGPNADSKETADEVVKRLTREMHNGLERAQAESGG